MRMQIELSTPPDHCAARSFLTAWKPVNMDQMRKFLGLVLHMGLVGMPSYKHYWRTDQLYKNHLFPSVMSRERFQAIMRFLHFGDRPEGANDRLAKIRLLVNHLNQNMAHLYIPPKNLALDESMMLWRGRLVFRQYIKNKRHKYGIKCYELCTHADLVLRVTIYGGQPLDDERDLGQTAAYVLHLMNDYLDKGYAVYVDNFYNSVGLAKYLSTRSTYITGTLRSNRKNNPKDATSAKLKKGEMIWRSHENIAVCKWKDKRDVLSISNAHVPQMVPVTNRRGEEKMKPNLIGDYNANMSGVDRSDQMLSYNSALRKTIR